MPKLGYRLIALPRLAAEPVDALPPPASAAAALDASGLPLPDPRVRRRTQRSGLVVGIVVVAVAALLALVLPQPPGAEQAAADLRSRVDRARPFATEPGFDQSGRFSRDGRWVAWSASDEDQERARIWVASRDGQSRHALSDGSAWDMAPVFVDDDSALVFVRYTANTCELREQKLIDKQSRRLTECAPPPAISRIDATPDGRRIAFARDTGAGRAGLALFDRAMAATDGREPVAVDQASCA